MGFLKVRLSIIDPCPFASIGSFEEGTVNFLGAMTKETTNKTQKLIVATMINTQKEIEKSNLARP